MNYQELIMKYQNQRSCWTCYFLSLERISLLFLIIYTTIPVSLTISGLGPTETE